jgi:hypothetical protein
MVPLASVKMKTWLLLVIFDLAGAASSERLCQRTPLDTSYLKIAGSNEIRSCAPYFFDCLVSGGSGAHLALGTE